jgi:serine/threonine-protein kinase
VSAGDDDPTIDPMTAPTRVPSTAAGDRPPSSSHGFAPGSVIAGRYRLVAMLGRGGMGEVYRADDLTLDHPVALKFLPAGVASDPDRLAQFHAELRIARQVSHKNVCRLYDIGQADGRTFLTMEYVDGEDLASLLRRIGRVPQDKAVDIARQLCAGLSAAHERGVLHRDLKPANVMIDGDGNVRIADFGLAVAAGAAGPSRAGTPQYMAPEQLAGGEATVRTDIYALGLVLFELFTGKRAYEAKTLNELIALQQSGTLATPSSVVRDLDPAVERVIMRCLERDPALRPASALAVAAALPGGDPLAAALAAGETPSPELVAAAGETNAVSATVGLSLLALIFVGLAVAAVLSDHVLLVARIPFERTTDGLEDRAREIVAKLGYTERPADTERGFFLLEDYFAYVMRTDRSPTRWNSLASGAFPSLRFWYRTSPRELNPIGPEWNPGFGDPPMTVSDMVSIVLDTEGRLTQLTVVPPQVDESAAVPQADWMPLFDAAGLEFDQFHEVPSIWVPNTYADRRAAWEGALPGHPDIPLRVEAGLYRGRPTFFQVVGPWTRRPRMELPPPTSISRVVRFLEGVIFLLTFGGALVLARFNIHSGRGDRRGATRVATFVLVMMTASWVLGASHSTELLTEFNHYINGFLPTQLRFAGTLWLAYVALEPYVRRFYPEILISWTRVLGGRFRDARVGRDVLVGVSAALLIAFVRFAYYLVPPLLGWAPPPPRSSMDFAFLFDARHGLSALLAMPSLALNRTMLITLTFVVMRVIVKRTWLAAIIAGAIFSFVVTGEAATDQLALNTALTLVISAAFMTVLVRFGVLAMCVSFLAGSMLNQAALTADFSRVYAPASIWVLALVAGLALAGFWASRDRQPLLGRALEAV